MTQSSKTSQGGYDPNVVFVFAQEFAKSMQQTTATIQELLGELRDHSVTMTTLKEQFNSMKENVQSLNALIRDEGSGGSLITRLAILNNRVTDLEKWREGAASLAVITTRVADLEEWRKSVAKNHELERREQNKGRYAVWVAIITGGLAIAGVVLREIIGAARGH